MKRRHTGTPVLRTLATLPVEGAELSGAALGKRAAAYAAVNDNVAVSRRSHTAPRALPYGPQM